MSKIDSTRLRELVNYDPITGVFTWKAKRKRCSPDTRAGGQHPAGYVYIRLDDRAYAAHRLAWLYVYGTWPLLSIDHINRCKSDNRIENLREVTHTKNMQNKTYRTAKLMGARKRNGRWVAELGFDGETYRMGRFDTPEEAHLLYLMLKQFAYNTFMM